MTSNPKQEKHQLTARSTKHDSIRAGIRLWRSPTGTGTPITTGTSGTVAGVAVREHTQNRKEKVLVTCRHVVTGVNPDRSFPSTVPQGVEIYSGPGASDRVTNGLRRAGGRTLCLPFLCWMHRFGRPGGVPYTNTLEDRLRNYLVGWTELGLDTAPVDDHFREIMGDEFFESVRQSVQREFDNS